ncbi:MmgE/PrpD family protein [Ammonicoccus fulvus]|uniref:MmgE/PrpD family protein n=1 Tax=Ammonicoccus fulvus TaxID=3138240 RepID=A0ABZ3FN29_9ACTN
MTPPPITAMLAELACSAGEAPAPAVESARRSLLDTLAVAVAGMTDPVMATLTAWVRTEAAPGPAAVWGSEEAFGIGHAALLNGTAAHALDWDDAVPSMPMHPAAVIFPALLAQAATEPVTGSELAAAFHIGSTATRAVFEVLGVGIHYGRGWHSTSTVGRIANVMALARLLKLDEKTTRNALAIAASLAAGSLSNFGTMTKPLHCGLAAKDALMAVGLARSGFTGRETQLEDRRGFFAMYGDQDPARLDTMGKRWAYWSGEWWNDLALKRYPSCFATHKPLDGVLALRDEIGPLDRITDIEVETRAGYGSPLISHLPTTGLEGKFSMPYTVASALTDGRVSLEHFTDERVNDPEILPLMKKVRETTGGGEDDPQYAEVRITRIDGSVVSRRVLVTYGDATNPLADHDLKAKFLDATAYAGWAENDAEHLFTTADAAMTSADLAPLLAALARKGNA